MRPPRRTRLLPSALALGVVVLLAPWAGAGPPAPTPPRRAAPPAAAEPAAEAPAPPAAAAEIPQRFLARALPTAADRLAGVRSREVPRAGSGQLAAVPGAAPAPGPGPVHTVRVAVERGVPVDPQAFAAFVMATLNDPRGWGRGGALSFARTDGPAPLQVVLASPATTERLCHPLDTGGVLSCRNGEHVVITHHRWVHGTPEHAADLTEYRRYVVNHEVGHALGHGHVPCPGPGAPAPVMQQQTLGLDGCRPNAWPHP